MNMVLTANHAVSTKRLIAGWSVSGLAILFLAMDSAVKFSHAPQLASSFAELGMPLSLAPLLGTLELLLLVLYAVPRTANVGALLWTGYLGGAIAVHMRVGDPLVSHTLFPLLPAALVWGGRFLRDSRLAKALFVR